MAKRKLTIWLKEMSLKKYGTIEALNEPYVVAFAADGRSPGAVLAEGDALGAYFPDGLPRVSNYVFTAVSPLYPKMRRGEALPILGKGLRLFGPAVVDGPIQLNLAVMESDRDLRRVGKALRKALKDDGVAKVVRGAADAAELAGSKWALVVKALGIVTDKVVEALANNGDDMIRTFSYGEDFSQSESPYEERVPLTTNRYVKGALLIEWE